MSLPPVTLVTGCFCFSRFHGGARSPESCMEQMIAVMEVPCYLVIYADRDMMPLVKKARPPSLWVITNFVEIQPESLPAFRFLDTVRKNRAEYWPTRDDRTCAETHLITCSKMHLVLDAMDKNVFGTPRFGWVDAFVGGPTARKICEDYHPTLLLEVLAKVTDKFHIQVLNVCDKKFMLPENKREYYQEYRWVVCGSFFTCGIDSGRRVLRRVTEIFEATTLAGYGHGEEMLFLEVLEEHKDDIVRAYGDYGQILNNFIQPSRNISYIIDLVLMGYLHYRYFHEAVDCASAILQELEAHRLRLGGIDSLSYSSLPMMYMNLLFLRLQAVLGNRDYKKAHEYAHHIVSLTKTQPLLQTVYQLHKNSWGTHLRIAGVDIKV